MQRIIHLVPHLPPEICGVGDYATLVGGKIEELHADIRCGYVACGHRQTADVAESETRRDVTGDCSADKLWRAVAELAAGLPAESVAIVLHYSGYGYSPNGAPTWLAEALERCPAEWSSCRVATFFHELFAMGRPWERAFWMSGRQQTVARRVARASHELFTNREQSARWLEEATGRPPTSVTHLPVPSNVGESVQLPEWEERTASAVLFGGVRFKQVFLTRQAAETIAVCRGLSIRSILEIGAPATFDRAPFLRAGVSVEQTGFLSADKVSRAFQHSQFALVDYFPGYAAKSGVLAAAAAHGTPPIFPRDICGEPDGLRCGEHYLDLRSILAAETDTMRRRLSAIGQSIHDWYCSHSVVRHAESIVTTISDRAVSPSPVV